MLDLKFILNNPEIVKMDLKKRRMDEKIFWVDDIIRINEKQKEIKKKLEELRHLRNKTSEEINRLKKQGKSTEELLKKASKIPEEIKELESEFQETEEKIKYYLMRIPNILHESVPIGKDDSENVELYKKGVPKKIDFELKPHGQLAEELGIADFKRAAKVIGTGFVYLKKELALLDIAIQRFAIDFLMKKGFELIEPPFMLGRKAYEGVTSLEDFQNVMYKIEGEEAYMIATAEHPLVSMYKDEVIDESNLPIKLVGFSPCFRKEIGSHGVDTRGFFRMHQFNKVEQVVFSKPEDSWYWFEEILKNTEEMLQKLELPYRVVNICTGDIGIVASKKYDIEVWFPRENAYREVASCSNCTSYQAVRLNIKLKRKNGEKEYLHTLNNTGLATSRIMRAILENYQNKDGSVDVPKVLQQYMNGIKKIEKA
ncbi:MAG: serine--tRNA ligase [Candidatus Woesearchaeota archaeon]